MGGAAVIRCPKCGKECREYGDGAFRIKGAAFRYTLSRCEEDGVFTETAKEPEFVVFTARKRNKNREWLD